MAQRRGVGVFQETGVVFESRRAVFSNTKPSNIIKDNLVAPTGFDRITWWLEVDFEGVALAA